MEIETSRKPPLSKWMPSLPLPPTIITLIGEYLFSSIIFSTQFSITEHFPLAREKVRFVGEPVAVVLAPSRYAAEDIAELVEVDYEPLEAVVDPELAMAPESPRLYEEWESNSYFHNEFSSDGVDAAFEAAAGTIERRFSSQRHTGTPLETRGIVASWDRGSRKLLLEANYQDVFLARAVISKILDLPQSSLQVVAPDTGGAFGLKLPIYPEELVCAAIAIHLGGSHAVKWIQDRREDLTGTTQARDMVATVELAYDDNAGITAVRSRMLSDAGAYGIPARGNTVEGMIAARDLTGPYDVADYSYVLDVVMTNKPPICVYRGVGLPMSVAFMERMMDELAKATGLDRVEVRRRNMITKFPHRTVVGYEYEPGSYLESLERATELIGFDGFADYQREMREQGRLVGLGIGTGCEAVARGATWYGERGVPISGQEGCQIRVDPDGRVHAFFATTAQGQGIETALTQILADELGVDMDQISITMGDTEKTPYGAGAWASRQIALAGSAACIAGERVREKLLKIAAHALEVSAEDLELREGTVSVKGSPTSQLSIEEIARMAYFTSSQLPDDIEPTIEETAHFDPPPATFSNATHAVILEIDPDTAHIEFLKYVIVHDAGRIVNPLIVEGQLYGATAQGIGGTIHEHVIYDAAGQPLATSFMDYLLPSSFDVPTLEIEHIETESPFTGLGIKGVGESGTCFAPAAILTGVSDALGVEANRLGLSPMEVYGLMR